MNTVRHNLKALRLKKGMTQDELAERLHVVRQTVSSWETGKTEPGIDTLMEIAEALSVDVSELLYGPRPQTPFELERPRRKRRAWILGAVLLALAVAALVVLKLVPRWYEAETDLPVLFCPPLNRALYLFGGILPQLCYFLFPAAVLSILSVSRDLRIRRAGLRWGLILMGAALTALYVLANVLWFTVELGAVAGALWRIHMFLYLHAPLFLLPGVPFALGLNR